VEKYRNREINAEDIEQARQDLTLFYVNKGYINSGAILPDQDGKNGIITFQLVEGRLTGIKLKGNFWFRRWWLRNEIRRGAGRPLNFNKLKETLQLLRQDPTISQINAELQPGGVPGESILAVDIKDTQPFRFAIEFNNKRPPSVGAEIVRDRRCSLLNRPAAAAGQQAGNTSPRRRRGRTNGHWDCRNAKPHRGESIAGSRPRGDTPRWPLHPRVYRAANARFAIASGKGYQAN
jgi:POTRA domain, ShlB-type